MLLKMWGCCDTGSLVGYRIFNILDTHDINESGELKWDTMRSITTDSHRWVIMTIIRFSHGTKRRR